jgi:hypothetical protein
MLCLRSTQPGFVGTDPAQIVYNLLELSLVRGSKDNHSALLVMFRDGTSYNNDTPDFVAGPFTPWQHDQAFVKAYKADALKHGYEGEKLMEMARETEAKMPELENQAPAPRPNEGGPPGGVGGLLESILAQPGQDAMREKLMLLTAMLQGGGGDGADKEDGAPMEDD